MIASASIVPGTIAALHTGKPAPLHGDGMITAFCKTPRTGPVALHPLGFEGDTQVNRRWHGGAEKAVYGYPLSGYAGWRAEFPALADQFVAGAMGENLVVSGMDEASVHIGDIIRCGTALLQVSQLREPCSTFTAVHGSAKLAKAMVRSARCGWYYRVLEPGIAATGDAHDIIERPNPGWPVARFAAFAASKAGTIDALAELTTLPGLNPDWQAEAAKRLARQQK